MLSNLDILSYLNDILYVLQRLECEQLMWSSWETVEHLVGGAEHEKTKLPWYSDILFVL